MARRKWNHNGLYHDGNGKFRSKDVMVEDDYSENSGNRNYYKSGYPKFTTDGRKPESLNGPVIIVQQGRKKDGNV